MELKITTLIENNPSDSGELIYEYGFSMYIEADGKKVLFDTGHSGDFIVNAGRLHKELNKVDLCLISHAHHDHGGGYVRLINEVYGRKAAHEINDTAIGTTGNAILEAPPIMVGEEFFKPKYKRLENGEFEYNGVPFDEAFLEKHQIPLHKVKGDILHITDRLIIFHHFQRQADFEQRNPRFFIKEGSEYIPDDFDDEIVLGIITDKGLVVVAGCSHAGLINILKTISDRMDMPIYAVIGGTHLIEADKTRQQKTVDCLKEMGIKLLALSHCTGEEGMNCIRQEMREEFFYNNTGAVIEI